MEEKLLRLLFHFKIYPKVNKVQWPGHQSTLGISVPLNYSSRQCCTETYCTQTMQANFLITSSIVILG